MPQNNIKKILTILVTIPFCIKTNESWETIKPWNFLVYICSNNDLYEFSKTNIKQMKKIGSNAFVNVLVQHDTIGKQEISRLFIEKKNAKLIEKQKDNPESISGTAISLYKFVEWAVKNYPSKKIALIMWDHGTGIYDPDIWKKNALTSPKGICFNETFEQYINNQDLGSTLKQIKHRLLKGKKIEILGIDACYMAMIEVASQIKNYAKFLVSSQEDEPGAGWNYSLVLEAFNKKKISTIELTKEITKAYKKEYKYIYQDYTQSTIKLYGIEMIEENINRLAIKLIKLLNSKESHKLVKLISSVRNNPKFTTEFAGGTYIDLGHFYKGLLEKIKESSLEKKNKLEKLIKTGIRIILNQITSCVYGKNMENLSGVSICFPRKKLHESYLKTKFAHKTAWPIFLELYLKNSKKKYD